MRPEILYTIFEKEGGDTLVNDPDDPGGLTKYGISQRAYKKVDIANLTLAQAYSIYETDYWNKLDCDKFDSLRVRWKLFDTGVNQGVIQSVIVLQRALRITADGAMGPVTVAAANATCSSAENEMRLLHLMSHHQMKRYGNIITRNPPMLKFLVGWTERAFDIGDTIPTYNQ